MTYVIKTNCTPPAQRRGASSVIVLCAILLVACLAALVAVVLAPGPKPPEPPQPPSPRAGSNNFDRSSFFDEQVQPVIAKVDLANREAAERCIERLREMFRTQRQGIAPFVDEMTSLGTRFGILRRMPSDWWYERNEVRDYITQKFERNLFSQESLDQVLRDSMEQFRRDLNANSVELLSEVKAAVSESDLSDLPEIDFRQFSNDVSRSMQQFVESSSVDSVTKFVIIEIASGVGGAVASQLVAAITARLVASTAAAAGTAGGATVAGTAAGGGGGTAAGPGGTVIGAGVGFVVGIIIDWWMTARFEEQLSAQLNEMIDGIESAVIDGGEDTAGLQVSLDVACDALRDSYRQSLFDRIVSEESR